MTRGSITGEDGSEKMKEVQGAGTSATAKPTVSDVPKISDAKEESMDIKLDSLQRKFCNEESSSNISNGRFETFKCPANETRVILNGALAITCKDNPITVNARICQLEEFDCVIATLSKHNLVRT